MFTLEELKRQLGVKELHFLKGKGRSFCNVGNASIVIGISTDITKKPLFVMQLTTADGEEVENGYVVVNSAAVADVTL